MPAQKRSLQENPAYDDDDHHEQQQQQQQQQHDDETPQQNHNKQSSHEQLQVEEQRKPGDEDLKEDVEVVEDEDGDDSDGTPSSASEEKSEFVFVELPDIRKDVQCPICLGIIKKTRTVMECLHRFCRECIDKSMRLGNNECPACRTHCASRRSLRDDPNYDALIAALYPDIDKYEEEELAFHEEERTRNKQIQASIAQIFQRQSEALVKRRTTNKDNTFTLRLQRNPRSGQSRRRRIGRGTEHQGSEDNEDENDDNGGKDSSSNEERTTEVRPRRRKRQPGIRSSQPSSSAVNLDGGCLENDSEMGRESRGISPGLVWNPEMLAWGRGGARSNTRHGNANNCNSKSSRIARLNKLVEYLRSLQENNDEYVSLQTPLEAEEVEILMVKEQLNASSNQSTPNPSTDQVQSLEGQETLAGLRVNYTSSQDHLILAYRRKQSS
ncbi:hypothetical protein Ddye_018649 [Dipteronia dyeriana]|uniref:RING-type domain-containing protein n=1 Tax=Dipteronia dyeriana TaxID=168575 RepID=A0AAD9UBT4_9ROSI|nr:hypothetical protein Ddye_018649 [Dipteronia dyeriana]